jgi:hypothetical protein
MNNSSINDGNTEINHSSPAIFNSDIVTITFEDQKNREHKGASPGCSKNMNTVLVNGRLIQITATMMVASIRSAASTLGCDRLGYGPESFGTPSIQCGLAVVMHLGGCATFVIMIAGPLEGGRLHGIHS